MRPLTAKIRGVGGGAEGGGEGVEVGGGRGRHCSAFRRMVTPGPEKSSERATMFSGSLSFFGLHSRVMLDLICHQSPAWH